MQYHTMVLTDGTQVTVRALMIGPRGVIAAPRVRPRLYLLETKWQRYARVPQAFTEDDIPALQEKIERPAIFGA